MINTLKDFLQFGLQELEKDCHQYRRGEKYIAVDSYDFAGTCFATKKEAKEMWQEKNKEEKTPNIMNTFEIEGTTWELCSKKTPKALRENNSLQYDECYYWLQDGEFYEESLHSDDGHFDSMTVAESSLLCDLF